MNQDTYPVTVSLSNMAEMNLQCLKSEPALEICLHFVLKYGATDSSCGTN